MPRCSPPKSQSIADYFRAKPRKKAVRKPDTRSTHVVVDKDGDVVSRHRSSTAAVQARRRYERADRRRGRKPNYSTRSL